MPFLILYILFILLFLPSSASAKVNVEVSNNLDGSSNNVNINSDTSGTSYNTVNNQTNIRINNNGEIKEYHGNGGNIDIRSDDGKSSVSVNTTGATNNSNNTNASVTSKTNVMINSNTVDSSPSAESINLEATVAGISSKAEFKEEGIWEFIKEEIKKIVSIFS